MYCGRNGPMSQYQSTMDAAHKLADSYVMDSGREDYDRERTLVAVVDDDESVRESLPDLLNEFGFGHERSHRRKSFCHPAALSKRNA